MKSFAVILQKEFVEYARTYKLFLIVIIFLLLGIMSPLAAHFMPDILKAVGIDPAAMGPAGALKPTYLQSFEQYYKNVGQMGLLVLAILFAGVMATDISRQTLPLLLAKGLRRDVVVLSKFSAASLLWLLAYGVSLVAMFGYTLYYFDIPSSVSLMLPLAAVALYGVFMIALMVLGGTVFKSVVGGLMTVGVTMGALLILGIFSDFAGYNPATLVSANLAAMNDPAAYDTLVSASWVTTALTFGLLVGAIVAFRRVEL